MAEAFLWGAATSAHQVEGNNVSNDWWAWERRTVGIELSGRAADHYHHFREDFALARQLGHNAHRLSLEWSRIEPEPGRWNKRELDHYRQVLEELKAQQLSSFVTCHHFTSPLWLARAGGWMKSDVASLFARYVDVVVQHLGDLVDYWVTINEPMVYATQSYWYRRWPPQHKSAWQVMQVVRHMAAAHRQAYRVIHQRRPNARVGVAKHVIAYLGGQWFKDYWFNHWFLSLTRGTHDFIGVNYYFSDNGTSWQGPVSDLEWPINSEGLKHILLEMRRYNLPIYVTENGLADADDTQRADYIRAHLRAVEDAQRQGADVRGYLHWSLLDNYEWDLGFAPRFGLVAVDYETMQRKVRQSAYVYKAIIENAS